ncbi:hypothetical protein CDG79_27340 [Nostoc sp. 'Peltigera membranacea cyanobiont' 232]|nr:hypothetical protein CDG79_27340 [Nostoc sp. 'Peltigera membranacea cyanobiont' 232]
MPENSIQKQASYPRPKVVSISKNTEKREPAKYNKPHGIIPLADISWMTTHVSDGFGQDSEHFLMPP